MTVVATGEILVLGSFALERGGDPVEYPMISGKRFIFFVGCARGGDEGIDFRFDPGIGLGNRRSARSGVDRLPGERASAQDYAQAESHEHASFSRLAHSVALRADCIAEGGNSTINTSRPISLTLFANILRLSFF